MRRPFLALLIAVAGMLAQPPRPAANILQQAFGVKPLDRNPLLSPEFPSVALLFANRASEVQSPQKGGEVLLRAPGSEAVLVASLEHQGIFDFVRIRHQAGSP